MEITEATELTKFETFSKEQLIDRVGILESECVRLARELYNLKNKSASDSQIRLVLEEQLRVQQAALYGASSEKYEDAEDSKEEKVKEAAKALRIKKPSERYPNIPVREELVKMDPLPSCEACGAQMSEMQVTEDSEQLTVIPKKYEILRIQKMKYRCSCHGCIVTAPLAPRVIPGSSYSDEMILDVALSKYCDLIPVERYCKMAARGGLKDLPAHSLIETTHQLAGFLNPVYESLKAEVLSSKILHADETPHRMLEGSDTKSWYLWGFSNEKSSYFECHDTRSGDVASQVLKDSACEFLMSDVYSGYGKAVRVANIQREKDKKGYIQSVHCNAHARRYFFKCWQSKYKESQFYLKNYQEIYKFYGAQKSQAPPDKEESFKQIKEKFTAMRERALSALTSYSEKSQYGKALRYFLENYEGLTKFVGDPQIPIDNNLQERLLRSPVVGRKTWYGTHSKLGARTAAILFSIVESCKLNDVNPREYFPAAVKDLLAAKSPRTPFQFKNPA